jgi:serine/threonine-protein kinase
MLAEAESDRLVGVVLGGAYELVGRIGEGGMGAVYEAHHLRLQKRVAVKLMNRAMARHPDALARFHREARIASRLGHPNLVNVMDFGTSQEGEPYLVMEHLEGEDLERRIRRAGLLPLAKAVQIARQVASALAVVHTKGIVHRDLKPANVFLVQVPGEPDLVKVLDFGVSKIKAASTKLTDASTVLGTPEYMSPEQASGSGEDIDHRADQWALACIVWEMLSGRTPFTADHADAIFYQLAHVAPPPLSKYAPDLPETVETVLLRALSKNAADRYPSVREFARALELAALGDWSELTPMPFSPAQIAALRGADPVSELRPRLATALAASTEVESDGSAKPNSARRRNARFGAGLSGIAAMIAVLSTGLLFEHARSRGSFSKPIAQVSQTNVSTAQVRPIAAAEAMGEVLNGKSTIANQSSSPPPSKKKTVRLSAPDDPFENTLRPSRTGLPKKSNPFANPSASRARRSSLRADWPARLQVARPDGRGTIFEDL